MLADVYQLPSQDLALALQSFTARGQAPYLEAAEELRAAVATTIAENSLYLEPEPMAHPLLTVVCFTGKRRHDGRFRPESPLPLLYLLDPIIAALRDERVIGLPSTIAGVTVRLEQGSPHEGFRIRVTDVSNSPAERNEV